MDSNDFRIRFLSLSDQLYRVAFYILEEEQAARDVLQDLYLKLWDSKEALDKVINPKAYAITLLRNLCLDRIRRAGRSREVGVQVDIGSDEDISENLNSRQRLQRVMAVIRTLPTNQQTVLRLRVFEQKSYEQIAQITGMNQLTLRVLLSQARSKLKKVR